MLNGININVFFMKNKTVCPVYLCHQCFKDNMGLLLINDHYLYIKDFNRLMFNRSKNKNKKWFCKSCLQCFSDKNVLIRHKKDCLIVNGCQSVKSEKGFLEFKNFNREIPVPFKIYADFECLLKSVDCGINNDCFSYTSKYQDYICSFAYQLVCVDNKYSKDVVLYRGKNAVLKFLMCFFKEYEYCKGVIKNLVMTAEQRKEFERTNICWTCGKLIEIGDKKVRDHCHIFGSYRGAAHHYPCNIDLKISKKLPAIFHNLRGYDSHLIFGELSKFYCKVSVIPNGLEKYMSFTLNGNIVFINSMLFLNRILDKLVKNLSHGDFKYLSEEFSGEKLDLGKKKGVYPYEYMGSFRKFEEIKLSHIECFFFL